MTTVVLVFAGLFGLAVGSFLNVVAYRLPRGESLSTPPSRCPSCSSKLRWFDNIPVVSWVLLGGRCRYCETKISPRYPLIEFAAGVVFVMAAAMLLALG